MTILHSANGQTIGPTNPLDVSLAGSNVAVKATNGATLDDWRNNTEGTLLASAARTTTGIGPDQTNHNAPGVSVIFDVTANPGGVETLTLNFQEKDVASGKYITVASAAIPAAVNAVYELQLYPAAVETIALGQLFVQGIAVGRTWRAFVAPSGVGSWTYSLGFKTHV